MLKQTLQQKLLQKLSPQQIQLMKLLQLPTIALEQRIKEELEINPALEEGAPEEDRDDFSEFDNSESDANEDNSRDDFNLDSYIDDDEIPSYKLSVNNYGQDDEKKEIPYSGGTTFHEQLENQLGLHNLNDKQIQIAHYIIGNIDDDGYLRREIDAMVDDLAFTQNIICTNIELEEVLKVIQDFEPAGIGARSLQECLLIQLKKKDQHYPSVKLAIKVIDKFMEEFSKKHYDKITKRLEISDDDLKVVIDEIVKLNPKPGNSLSDNQKSLGQVIPDFLLINNEGVLELSLNARNSPELRVSKEYAEMLNS